MPDGPQAPRRPTRGGMDNEEGEQRGDPRPTFLSLRLEYEKEREKRKALELQLHTIEELHAESRLQHAFMY
ncbi:hypothetical protein ACJ72_04514 [Emergomyces africanus]|uniref:Uncharacterized protein n=1 Tax=Emergomyces africanus TaxID=1955775 RepID=A0A1B7NX02_9EURO|nr:hypothetical protein ACJ72_04514 [Emergomyces africanus]